MTDDCINTNTVKYMTLTPNAEDSSIANDKIESHSAMNVAKVETTIIYSTSHSELCTTTETLYTTELSTTESMEPDSTNFANTEENCEETTTNNTEDAVNTNTDRYKEQFTDAEALTIRGDNLGATPTTERIRTTTDLIDILNYFTTKSVTSAEALYTTEISSTVNIEPDQLETLITSYTEEGITTTATGYAVQSALNVKPTTVIPNDSTTDYAMLTSTENYENTAIFTTEDLRPIINNFVTIETNQVKTTTTDEDGDDVYTTTINDEEPTISIINTTPNNVNNSSSNIIDKEITTETATTNVDIETPKIVEDFETSNQVCEQTITEDIEQTQLQSESDEKFETVTFTTGVTEFSTISKEYSTNVYATESIDVTTEWYANSENTMFSTIDNPNLNDSIRSSIVPIEETKLMDVLKSTIESNNNKLTMDQLENQSTKEVLSQNFYSTSVKATTQPTTKTESELWDASTSSLLQDDTTEETTIQTTEFPNFNHSEDNIKLATETTQIETIAEIIEQSKEMTTDSISERIEISTTEVVLSGISGTETSTEKIVKNVIDYKGNATARILLINDTTTNFAVEKVLKKPTDITDGDLTTTSSALIKINTDDKKTIIENSSTLQLIVTTERSINVGDKSKEEISIKPLYRRQQALVTKNARKESSNRKAKKFNYATDVMPSLGDYDYI